MTVFAKDMFWKSPIESLGVRVESLSCSGSIGLPGALLRLNRLVKKLRPDLIHTHLFAANILGRLAGFRSGIPVISSIHNPEYEPEAASYASAAVSAKIRFARMLDRWTAALSCGRMIAVSEFVKHSAVDRLAYPADRIEVIYNPVHLYNATSSRRDDLIKSLNLNEDSILILNIARIAVQKGQIYAVRSMPKILDKYPSAVLLLVGSHIGEYRNLIEEEAKALGITASVRLLGERNDIAELLAASHLFLFPSLFEGMGIALAEAMAAGVPCIATNISPINEFIDHDANGLLTPPRDIDALAEEVIDLLGDAEKRRRLGAAADRTARRMFDPTVAAELLTKVYFEVSRDE